MLKDNEVVEIIAIYRQEILAVYRQANRTGAKLHLAGGDRHREYAAAQ